jgi:hypothetical protein
MGGERLGKRRGRRGRMREGRKLNQYVKTAFISSAIL